MSESGSKPSSRPSVLPDEFSRPFFDGCERGVLLIRRCMDCKGWNAPSDPYCSVCASPRLDWAASSGRGTVHTHGIVHHIYHPGFKDEAPYNVAVVELEEGPRLNTHIVGCEDDEIRVGMPVIVEFVTTDTDVVIPKFRPWVESKA
jgi:uncharacterized OB-fold protein